VWHRARNMMMTMVRYRARNMMMTRACGQV